MMPIHRGVEVLVNLDERGQKTLALYCKWLVLGRLHSKVVRDGDLYIKRGEFSGLC